MDDALLRHRECFPILAKTNYLISNSLGAMPAESAASVARYSQEWATRGVRAWAEGWWEFPRRVGDVVARLIGGGKSEVSMHLNVTLATATILSCFDWRDARNGVVATDMNFPSLLYLYERHARQGLRLVRVPTQDGVGVDTEAIIRAIDETTRIVAVDHVLFRSAYIQDARAITEAAHAQGALVVLDAFQSVGTIPVNVRELGVDFAVGGALKWLCGGPGAAWLWIRPELARTLEPALTGWMAHPESFSFDTGPMRFRDDAFRFENGTPNVPGLAAALPGLELLASLDAEAVRRKSLRQTARLVELAAERGWRTTCPTDPARRAGTVAVDVPHGKATCQELLARDIIVDYRPEAGIRISPHFYTQDEELDACMAEIADILSTNAYERHQRSLPKYG